MSDTTSTTDGPAPSDTPSSSVVDTPSTPAPPSAPADSTTPSSGSDSTAPSSGDSRQSDRDGLLAAVRKVVETKPETPAVPSQPDADAPAPDQPSQDQAAAQGQPGDKTPPVADPSKPDTEADPTEAELKKLRPETRRRFERLLAQRNEVRQSLDAVQPELQQHRQLQGYLQQHQLAPDDVNMLLGVGASLRRGDYQNFLNGVLPYVMAAQEALGIRIAPDLQKQVDEGVIDENSARELTRTRHRAAQAEARLKDANQTVTATQQTQHVDRIRGSVDTWEQGIRRRDPDYAQIEGAVRRYAQGLLQERGSPRNDQEAVALVQAAYDEVKATFAAARPAPKATRPAPSGIHVATGTPTAEPRTMKDAVVMALAQARRAS
jgi:hypothetical protein